jgi:hypothetical protein
LTSWRLALFDFGGHAPLGGARARVIGPRDKVRELVDDALADVAWSGARGVLRDGEASLEIDLGAGEPIEEIALRVDGPHPRVMRSLVVHLCRVNGWAARDLDSGRYLDLESDLDESLD